MRVGFLFCSVAVAGVWQAAEAGEFILVRDQRLAATIFAPGENVWAGRRLADRIERLTGARMAVVSEAAAPESNEALVAVGTPESNVVVREALAGDRRVAGLGEDGYILTLARWRGRPTLVAAGRTLSGANCAVSELVSWKLKLSDGGAAVPADLDEVDEPELKYRILWAWDSLVNFAESVEEMNAVQSFPADANGPVWFNKTSKDAYLTHFKRAMDFAADHKFNGYIVWGFMRDETGGLETGRELSRYAKQRNVRILPGVCTENAYGGFTFSRKSKYCLDVWTEEHPELKFKHPKGPLEPGICPSKPENIRWLREGTRWFLENLPDVGGMNLENGDWMLCSTEDCVAARARAGNDHNFLWDQMQTYTPVLEETARLRPDAWMIFATYIGFSEPAFRAEMATAVKAGFATSVDYPPRLLKQLPGNGIAQWTFTAMAGSADAYWRAGTQALPSALKAQIGLLHQGSIWGAPVDPKRWWAAPGASLDDASSLIEQTCARIRRSGLDGLVMKGQVGPASPANELNYVAMEYFTWHPQRTEKQFVKDRLAVCYGGERRAELFLRLLRNTTKDVAEVRRDREQAAQTARDKDLDVRQRAHWTNLADELARRLKRLDEQAKK
jgi:hypothetical protein